MTAQEKAWKDIADAERAKYESAKQLYIEAAMKVDRLEERLAAQAVYIESLELECRMAGEVINNQ